MSYIDKNLMESERVIYRSGIHWHIFIWPVIWFLAALVTFGFEINMKEADTRLAMLAAGGFFLFLSLILFVPRWIRYISSEFGITNRRVILKVGMFHRKSLEVLLNKVESILVNQSTFGTVMGFGSITVTGTGGTKDTFHNISHPDKFRKKVEEQIAVIQDR